MDFAQHLALGVALVGELEALAAAQLFVRADDLLGHCWIRPLDLHEVVVIEIFGEPEDHPAAVARVMDVRGAPALERFDLDGQGGLVGVGAGNPQRFFAIEQLTTNVGKSHLAIGANPAKAGFY